jgi:hypothetical protein
VTARSLRRLSACLLAASLVLTACGGDDPSTEPSPTLTPVEASPSPSPSPTPSPSPSEAGEPGPLNGLRHPAEELDQRVVAVKIDNHIKARPQSGLDRADAVYETLVEGGLTRFIALFHTDSPAYVGPNRSGRPTDAGLVRPLGATFVISGAQGWVLDLIGRTGVHLLGDQRPSSFRIASRSAPHNLYVSVPAVREAADGRGYPDAPPAPLWTFGSWADEQGEPASAVVLDWSADTDVRWEYDGESWLRIHDGEQHATVNEDGEFSQVSADVLVVLEAPRYNASPPAGVGGSSVPALDTVGSGAVTVFGDGRFLTGTWSRDSLAEPFTLTGADGEPLAVPPGRSWISVFPAGRAIDIAP